MFRVYLSNFEGFNEKFWDFEGILVILEEMEVGFQIQIYRLINHSKNKYKTSEFQILLCI